MNKYDCVIEKARSMVKDPTLSLSKLSTKAIHAGYEAFEHSGIGYPVIPPICLSTTFAQEMPAEPIKYDYSRAGNYNRELLEQVIAELENAKYCCSFSSGLATLSGITNLLNPGDHVLFYNDVYGGTGRFFTRVAGKFNIDCLPINLGNVDDFKKALRPNTKMVWLETPSNPLMRIVDIRLTVKIAKEFNSSILVVVDNTFLTPVFQQPIDLGADITVHSLTKYLNGHSDVLMGAAAMNSKDIYDALNQQQLMVGAVPSPFDCYLALRGIRTLVVRMAQHQISALAVALFLADHPKVEKILHPALFSSPEKEIIANQQSGFSGMLSFYLKGDKDDAINFMKRLKYFRIAESLGGFESLIEMPSVMTHASVPPDRRKELGITDNLIRVSIGLESVYSLLEDFSQALEAL